MSWANKDELVFIALIVSGGWGPYIPFFTTSTPGEVLDKILLRLQMFISQKVQEQSYNSFLRLWGPILCLRPCKQH